MHLARLPLSFLLIVANPSRQGLRVPDLAQVQSYGPGPKWVRSIIEDAPILLGVEAAPGLAEGARARSRGIWVAVEGTVGDVDFCLPELVKVPEEVHHVGALALGYGERGLVSAESRLFWFSYRLGLLGEDEEAETVMVKV
ncbi:ATPase component of ABC transporters [Striga asiatica]|uniref:ATPase component of ABC transporters n=1 Tax=Striga asiatica TaxID=4170 RepID=A0A5A7QQU5_STRAF|nr:ATPase component of ABC transporters [Striga asiatica]